MVEKIKSILEDLQKKTVEELASYDVKLEDGILQIYINTNAGSGECPQKCWPKKAMGELEPWQRMCYYQVSGSTGTDCDVALFTVVVYYLAYGLGEKGWKINKYKGKYQLENSEEGWDLRGDTMNSYATTVHGYIKNVWMQLPNNKANMIDKEIIRITSKRGNWGVNSKFKKNYWEDVILCNYDYFQNVLPYDGTKYIRLNHTIGNFIPVPFVEGGGDFNSPRGFDGSSYDFWDLALMCIYNYYFSIHDSTCNLKYPHYDLKWLLGKDQNVDLCRNWLDSFGSSASGWDTFVKQNFLQDFVEGEENDHYGLPKELWEGHFEGTVIPKKEEHYNDFFKYASERIEARGKKIAKKIKNELEGKDLAILANEMVCG